LDNVTASEYDKFGNLATVTDALNGVTEYEYDIKAHMIWLSYLCCVMKDQEINPKTRKAPVEIMRSNGLIIFCMEQHPVLKDYAGNVYK
jgi:YD repeat-containing protein